MDKLILSDLFKKQKIIIDPSIKLSYASFYIRGLEEVFGRKNIFYSSKYFKSLDRKSESHSYDHYMAFVLKEGINIRKVVIDFRDKVSVKESAYNWCDIYAKINFNKEFTDIRFHKKILSIPPGFGIKIFGFSETLFLCFANLLRCNFSIIVPFKLFLIDYMFQYFRRSNIEAYYEKSQIAISDQDIDNPKHFIFYISKLREQTFCMEFTNLLRKKFIESCKSNQQIDFEGGLLANPLHPQYAEFKEIIFSTRYSIESYIEKTKLSSFVFNTPAVHNCHGWKLGEFLAMGKAIISTPLSNELPEKLIHGKNIHIITNDIELSEAIQLLITNNAYRKHLENGAKIYYSTYVEPQSVIRFILGKLDK
jgi:hypothetical protein